MAAAAVRAFELDLVCGDLRAAMLAHPDMDDRVGSMIEEAALLLADAADPSAEYGDPRGPSAARLIAEARALVNTIHNLLRAPA